MSLKGSLVIIRVLYIAWPLRDEVILSSVFGADPIYCSNPREQGGLQKWEYQLHDWSIPYARRAYQACRLVSLNYQDALRESLQLPHSHNLELKLLPDQLVFHIEQEALRPLKLSFDHFAPHRINNTVHKILTLPQKRQKQALEALASFLEPDIVDVLHQNQERFIGLVDAEEVAAELRTVLPQGAVAGLAIATAQILGSRYNSPLPKKQL